MLFIKTEKGHKIASSVTPKVNVSLKAKTLKDVASII
jgi:hypothetical protein